VSEEHEVEVLASSRLVRRQVLAQLRRLLVGVGEDPVEAAVRVDELRGGLLADTRHTGKVVGIVATQRGVLRIQLRRHARAFGDPRLVVQRVVADSALVVEHLDVRILDELVAVAIAGDDDDVVAASDDGVRRRRDQVVGLPAGGLELLDAEGVEDLADETHLLSEDVGRRLPLRLVLRFCLVPERRLGPVERHQHPVGVMVLDHVDEHRREPEHGVGDLPGRRRHVGRQREERAVGQRVAIDEQVGAHGGVRAAASRRGCARRPRASWCARSSPCAG
jgi:hypothetical protein